MFGAKELAKVDATARMPEFSKRETDTALNYLMRFYHTTNITMRASLMLVEQLARFDFNSAGPFRVWFIKEYLRDDFEIHSFVLAPFLIEGWKRVGMIRPDGRWNLDAEPEQIVSKFEALSGLKAISGSDDFPVLGKIAIQSQIDYAKHVSMGRLAIEDFHDYLFHIPFLLDPQRRRFANLVFRFDVLRNVIDGANSYMNGLFEYGGSHDGKVLYGPIQMILETFPPKPLMKTRVSAELRIREAQTADLERMREIRWELATHFPILNPESKSWDLVLQLMKFELIAALKEIPRHRVRTIGEFNTLIGDIDSMRADLGYAE